MTLPEKLYHGTSGAYLANILDKGILPRKDTANSGWKHSVESRPDAVYLTTAYPLHYAGNATHESTELVILEISTSDLNEKQFIADEDALAHTRGEGDSIPPHWNLQQRTAYYREQSHRFSARDSLQVMGCCAYQGVIPVTAITRVATLSVNDLTHLIFGGFDPSVSPTHYRYLGSAFEQGVSWLFGDVDVWSFNPMLPRPDVRVVVPFNN